MNELVLKMIDALDDFAGICRRLNAQPLYGRDARNMGVADGFCVAPDEYELRQAQEKAREVCQEAVAAGLIKEIPYNISRY